MSGSLLVMARQKKLAARKWMSTLCGKEVTLKDKIEYLTAFTSYDFPAKTVCTKDLDF